ncbi:hypothetical protein [Streptomyces sp. CB01881]|nr:hypothetical protein [Streptomyces sp. CB01881]
MAAGGDRLGGLGVDQGEEIALLTGAEAAAVHAEILALGLGSPGR